MLSGSILTRRPVQFVNVELNTADKTAKPDSEHALPLPNSLFNRNKSQQQLDRLHPAMPSKLPGSSQTLFGWGMATHLLSFTATCHFADSNLPFWQIPE
jgi:hypothetical protein